LLEKPGQGQDFRANLFLKGGELWQEFVADLDYPAHSFNMTCDTYYFKVIFRAGELSEGASGERLDAAAVLPEL